MKNTQKTKNVTLLVDGTVLKKHMLELGQNPTAQQIVQYLTHMVQAIHQQTPEAVVQIQYYGSRLTEVIALPISGKPYTDPEIKLELKHSQVPGAALQTNWGRASYPSDETWILKPDSYHKNNLTDADFVLNEKPKGVLAQLVTKLADCVTKHLEEPVYVYGDTDDMAYALHTAKWMGGEVYQVALNGKKPYVVDVPSAKEPRFCDKNNVLQIGQKLKDQQDPAALLKQLRLQCNPKDRQSVLMVDVGVIRKYLDQHDCRMNLSNVQQVLDEITMSLPESPTKTVLYCAFATPTKLVSPFPGEARALIDASIDKQILSLPNVEFSAGKTIQDKWYPAILKRDKWHTPASERGYRDFGYNFHQCDVDDRLIWDMYMCAQDPSVAQLYLVALDGDFAYPVELAAQMGLPTFLVQVDFGRKGLSHRLKGCVDATLKIKPGTENLSSRTEEEEIKCSAQRVRCKKLQKMRKQWAKSAKEDMLPTPNREERWALQRLSNKRQSRQRIVESRKQRSK